MSADDASAPAARTALTRIIATVGPASSSPERLAELIRAGVSVFRLNLSHGTLDEHERALDAIRRAERAVGRLVATLVDLPGPKIRIGDLPAGGVTLVNGQTVRIAPCEAKSSSSSSAEPVLGCTYEGIVRDAEPGHRLLIDDGAVRLRVTGRRGPELLAEVLVGGTVTSRKGINLPDRVVRADAITERDRAGAAFAVRHGVDYVAMSFVQGAEDIRRLQRLLASEAGGRTPPPVVAKIERPAAVERIAEIVDVADAIMVARGDLGVEMDLAKVPLIQKNLLATARAAGRPSIVATQMLQSMIEHPIPTRAEASDVANAILDGCDAVMLSGETAVGRWPVVTVETMARIAIEAEAHRANSARAADRADEPPPERLLRERNRVAALAHGASQAARDLGVSRVVAWSLTGVTALLLSRYRFHVPISAVSTDAAALRRTRLLRGVEPLLLRGIPASFADFAADAEAELLAMNVARRGDLVLLVTGEPFGASSPAAVMAVREIGADPVLRPAGGEDGGGAG